jgi:hypothetical protein
MKTTILENIAKDKEIKKMNFFSDEQFYNDAIRYIKAIKESRVICSIGSVSRSGMSRTIKFIECDMSEKRAHWYNFHTLFLALGYKEARSDRDYFTISGCGMDMIFHTNYSIIHRLGRLGFLSEDEVRDLAQNTPPVI